MYAGTETSKETQHISPHIAAHKSSLATSTSSATNLTSSSLSSSGSQHEVVSSHVANKSGLSSHIPTYRVGIQVPHHSIVKGGDSSEFLLPRHSHSHGSLPSNLSKSSPQDLSAHAGAGGNEKAVPLELTPHTSVHHKPLPHINTVGSQAMNNSHVGTVIQAHQCEKGSYYRVQDPIISVQGQPCILVSTVGEGVSGHQPTTQTATLVHAQTSLPTQISATNLSTMPAASLSGTVTLPTHVNPLVATSLPQGHIVLTDCTSVPSTVAGIHPSNLPLEPKKEKMDNMNVSVNHEDSGGQMPVGTQQSVGSQPATVQQTMNSQQQQVANQQQSSGPQRDLVRQALQAVVTHPQQQKSGNDQEVIEYNYGAGEIAELLMMNIQVNASLQAINKGGPPPDNGSAQVVVLQPAAVDDMEDLQSPSGTPKQRRRPKLSEAAQEERRTKIACRMREKRAGESDEQKRLRRLREAERMRRKRATESDEAKLRRRLEAAARARHRRATMSFEERLVDRQKAAARMRLRRATESDEAKMLRRRKAAERMKKRRANETPEQRAQRRQNIAMRMKNRRKQKSDKNVNGEEDDEDALNCQVIKCESTRSLSPLQDDQEPVLNVSSGQTTPHLSSTAAQLVQSSPHVAIPSSVGGGIALLHVDPTLTPMAFTSSPVLSTVDMGQLSQSQPLPLHKSVTTSEHQPCEPLPLQKHLVASHPSSSSSTLSTVSSHLQSGVSVPQPIPLHKTSSHPHHLVHYQHSSSHALHSALTQPSVTQHQHMPPRHQSQQQEQHHQQQQQQHQQQQHYR